MTIQSVVEALAACLCAQFAEDELCFCGVVPGDSFPDEYFQEGFGWARLVDVVAVDPNTQARQSGLPKGSCSLALVATLEIGVMRCAPAWVNETTPPTVAAQAEAVTQQYADMMAMFRAVECCAANKDLVLGGYTPAGPAGNALGGFWTLTYTHI